MKMTPRRPCLLPLAAVLLLAAVAVTVTEAGVMEDYDGERAFITSFFCWQTFLKFKFMGKQVGILDFRTPMQILKEKAKPKKGTELR